MEIEPIGPIYASFIAVLPLLRATFSIGATDIIKYPGD
jgi:hypothetical protein